MKRKKRWGGAQLRFSSLRFVVVGLRVAGHLSALGRSGSAGCSPAQDGGSGGPGPAPRRRTGHGGSGSAGCSPAQGEKARREPAEPRGRRGAAWRFGRARGPAQQVGTAAPRRDAGGVGAGKAGGPSPAFWSCSAAEERVRRGGGSGAGMLLCRRRACCFCGWLRG